jgi:magnesium transporter
VTKCLWKDVLDPTVHELESAWPHALLEADRQQLLRPAETREEPRTRLEHRGDYLAGTFLMPVCVEDQDRVFYQRVDLIVTSDRVLTVRKSPREGDEPFQPDRLRAVCSEGVTETPGLLVYHLLDDAAESYLRLIEALDREISELEDNLETWEPARIRTRLSTLRHDLLQARQKLGPMRDAFRKIYDNQLDLPGEEFFPREVEVRFADAYDKVLRVTDSIELLRDLVAGVRDYHQAQVANEQNEIMKWLTIVASVLLLPTLIVGIYGQNFVKMPETHWANGYIWSWGLIIGTTLLQLFYFRRRGWIGNAQRRRKVAVQEMQASGVAG